MVSSNADTVYYIYLESENCVLHCFGESILPMMLYATARQTLANKRYCNLLLSRLRFYLEVGDGSLAMF